MKIVTKGVEAEAYLYDGNNTHEIITLLGDQFSRLIENKDNEIADKSIEMKSFLPVERYSIVHPGEYILRLGESQEYIEETADAIKEVFDIIPNDWLERLQIEKKKNDEKLDKLTKFIEKNRDDIDEAMEDLLETQADIMAAYSNIMLIRIKLELSRRGPVDGNKNEIEGNTDTVVFQGNK